MENVLEAQVDSSTEDISLTLPYFQSYGLSGKGPGSLPLYHLLEFSYLLELSVTLDCNACAVHILALHHKFNVAAYGRIFWGTRQSKVVWVILHMLA